LGDLLVATKVPIAILGAEIDQVSPPELVKQFEEVLKSKPEVRRLLKSTTWASLLTMIGIS